MYRYKAIKIFGKKVDKHRVIARECFGECQCKDKVVHHINGNPRDNRLQNLTIMTRAEHMNEHRADLKLDEEGLAKLSNSIHQYMVDHDYETVQNKKVIMFTKDGQFVREFKSCGEAGRNGFDEHHVAACCRGDRKSHKGFRFEYADKINLQVPH